jgi:DNA (cytosine-5)-methyltransferase 1
MVQDLSKQSSVLKQIGNAVPCGLARVVAEIVSDCLDTGEVIQVKNTKDFRIKQLRLTV